MGDKIATTQKCSRDFHYFSSSLLLCDVRKKRSGGFGVGALADGIHFHTQTCFIGRVSQLFLFYLTYI